MLDDIKFILPNSESLNNISKYHIFKLSKQEAGMALDVKEWSTSEVWHRINSKDLLKDVSDDMPLLQPNLETIDIFAGKLNHLLQKEYINADEKQEWLDIQNFDLRYCPPRTFHLPI